MGLDTRMMFKLVVMPNGKTILTTEERVTERRFNEIRDLFRRWHDDHKGDVLVMAETKVVQVVDVELDLKADD